MGEAFFWQSSEGSPKIALRGDKKSQSTRLRTADGGKALRDESLWGKLEEQEKWAKKEVLETARKDAVRLLWGEAEDSAETHEVVSLLTCTAGVLADLREAIGSLEEDPLCDAEHWQDAQEHRGYSYNELSGG